MGNSRVKFQPKVLINLIETENGSYKKDNTNATTG